MNQKKEKHLILRLFMGLIPPAVIAGFMILPNFLVHTPAPTVLDYHIDKQIQKDGVLYLQGSFKEDIQAGKTVWLYAENAIIQLKIQGITYTFNEKADLSAIFRSAGSGWFSFQSPKIKVNETVEMSVHSYYGDNTYSADRLLQNLCFGDGSELYHKAMKQLDFWGIILVFTATAGIIFVVEGAIDYAMGMTNDGSRIVSFGFYCFAGALWCVTDVIYPYLSLFITPMWMAGILDMSGILLFPIAIAIMMSYFAKGKPARIVMHIILSAEVLTALFCIFLQIVGIADLIENQLIIGAVALISIGFALVCIALELKHYREQYLLLLFLTVLPVFICNTLDAINILYPFMPRRTLMKFGFSVSALLMVLQLVSYAKAELAKAETMRRLETELEDSRITIMLSQIQPHFLYNSLTGIKQLTDSNPAKASEALEHFSFYLRRNLDSLVNKQLIPFQEEMEHVHDYLYLENMRFPKKIKVSFNLDFCDFMLPPLSVQSIVENAVRYGITKKKGGGTLTVHSRKYGEFAMIKVHDDGIGFHILQSNQDGRTHTGIENVSKRLKLQCSGTLKVESEENIGTTVTIMIPLKENTNENTCR